VRQFVREFNKQRRIIWALLLREISTRYGRDNIGFFWVVAEPFIFASGVSLVWSMIRPPIEHGLHLVPFLLTGYLPLILVRQIVNYSINGVRANQSLLYHRQITPLQLVLGRVAMEFIGVSLAAVIVLFFASLMGIMPPLKDFLDVGIILEGWFLVAWLGMSMALVMGALTAIFEFVERFANIVTYIMIPLSGCFFMVAWMPPTVRDKVEAMPFVHGYELIRRGFYGGDVTTYYNIPYAVACYAGMTLLGLFLFRYTRNRIEVE
jgi:capsular polysaccharide transport system permease protein